MIQALAFYLFSGVLVASAAMVVAARNPVHSVLFLILAFFNAAALFLLNGAEFLAMILVVVYVGAVAVLFLFVVMMLDINVDSLRQGFWKHFPLAAGIGVLIALEMAFVLVRGFDLPTAKAFPPEVAKIANAKALGIELYTHYLFPVQVAAAILLVGMIAAIALTLRKRKDSQYQNPSEQVRVTKAERLRIVKVAPQVETPVAEEAASTQAGGQA